MNRNTCEGSSLCLMCERSTRAVAWVCWGKTPARERPGGSAECREPHWAAPEGTEVGELCWEPQEDAAREG